MANQQKLIREGSLLDVIHEKVCNVEHNSNQQVIAEAIDKLLKQQGQRERQLRNQTITFKHNDKINHEKILRSINTWAITCDQLHPAIWQDKDNTYAQFHSQAAKETFANYVLNIDRDLTMTLPNNDPTSQLHQRRLVKIEIPNVKNSIQFDRVTELIKIIAGEKAIDIREGKPYGPNRARNIMFKTGAEGALNIFKDHDGSVQYHDANPKLRTKLLFKINAKPWQCKDCSKFGNHPNCEGKTCANCGLLGHVTKDCKSKTKYCSNCKRRGHKARDTHCPIYLAEVGKEIKKMDIPLEFYEEKKMRSKMAQFLQIK